MSRKIFIEDVAEAIIENTIKPKLNDKFDEIDNERNDDILLKKINMDEAILFQSWNDRALNFDPILFYSINESKTISPIPSQHAASWEIEFSIIFKELHEGPGIVAKKLFRYQRALRELFQKDYITIGNTRRKVEIRNLNPVSFQIQNNDQFFRAVGVVVETTLAD